MPKVVDHDARRLDFIEAASQTIIEAGIANTTIRAVAKKAGYTTGALVHYFGDKDELIRLTLQHFGKEVRGKMVSAHLRERGRAALRSVLIAALPTDARTASSWRVWMALWYHSELSSAMRVEERRRYREWIGRLKELLSESVAMAELPTSTDVDMEARSLVAFIDGLGVQHLMAGTRTSQATVLRPLDAYLARLYPRSLRSKSARLSTAPMTRR